MTTQTSIPILGNIPDVLWPPIAGAEPARLLVQLMFLEQSQWLPREAIESNQLKQLTLVARHAAATTEYYKQRFAEWGVDLSKPLTPESFAGVPILTRRDIQLAREGLFSDQVPEAHGRSERLMTSGSTGEPVLVHGTAVTRFFWRALTLRDHLWHQRDFSGRLATIRFIDGGDPSPNGRKFDHWGTSTKDVVSTGPCFLFDINRTIEEQATWLRKVDPTYLLTYPSAVRALTEVISRDQLPPNLREIRTFGETVDASLRDAVRTAWDLPVKDVYSTQEVGYIALQCPEHDHYHVQTESVHVEIIDDQGKPCGPGEVGRVVVSSLHNMASPLLRYAIGDYAEVGEECSCGRKGLVLNRILGRERNLLVLPDGRRRWPTFAQGGHPEDLPPFFQFQIVQKSLSEVELRVVRPSALKDEEKERARRYLHETLGHPFDVTFTLVEEIPRSQSGKFEDFRSELPTPG